MSDTRWLRLVDIVRRELSAADARVEIGGQPPDDPRVVHCQLSEGARIVAVFAEPPEDRDVVAERLHALVETFPGIAASIVQRASTPPAPSASSMLEDELVAVCSETGAVMALIMDASSPVIWACSEPLPDGFEHVQGAARYSTLAGQAALVGVDLPTLLASSGESANDSELPAAVPEVLAHAVRAVHAQCPDISREGWQRYGLAARALTEARQVRFDAPTSGEPSPDMFQEPGFGWLVRPFATIYRVVLVFDAPFTELSTRGALVRALPWIERLVLSLPPTDPGTAAGQVVRLRARRRKA